jgi:hypothetical protein
MYEHIYDEALRWKVLKKNRYISEQHYNAYLLEKAKRDSEEIIHRIDDTKYPRRRRNGNYPIRTLILYGKDGKK